MQYYYIICISKVIFNLFIFFKPVVKVSKIQNAVMNIMEPIWVSIFIKNTYSCIKHRGIHEALQDVREALKDTDNTTYCLKLDIRKFYPSIDHEVLKSIIRKKIKDQKLLQLLDEIIDSAEGAPIGNYLSQFFAKMYYSIWIVR